MLQVRSRDATLPNLGLLTFKVTSTHVQNRNGQISNSPYRISDHLLDAVEIYFSGVPQAFGFAATA